MADVALNVSKGLAKFSDPETGGWDGVAKSIKSPSFPLLPVLEFWFRASRAGVRRRVSSNDGMFRTGETGTVGLRIDLRGKEAVDCKARESGGVINARGEIFG